MIRRFRIWLLQRKADSLRKVLVDIEYAFNELRDAWKTLGRAILAAARGDKTA